MENKTCAKCPYYNNIGLDIGRCIVDNEFTFKVYRPTSSDECYITDKDKDITQYILGNIKLINPNYALLDNNFIVSPNNLNRLIENINILEEENKIINNKIIIAIIDSNGIVYKRTRFIPDVEFIAMCDSMKNQGIIRFNRYAINMYNDKEDSN